MTLYKFNGVFYRLEGSNLVKAGKNPPPGQMSLFGGDFDEAKHKRDSSGKFTSGGGGGSSRKRIEELKRQAQEASAAFDARAAEAQGELNRIGGEVAGLDSKIDEDAALLSQWGASESPSLNDLKSHHQEARSRLSAFEARHGKPEPRPIPDAKKQELKDWAEKQDDMIANPGVEYDPVTDEPLQTDEEWYRENLDPLIVSKMDELVRNPDPESGISYKWQDWGDVLTAAFLVFGEKVADALGVDDSHDAVESILEAQSMRQDW